MKNKTKKPFIILFSILIGIILTISIGFSIWLITERVEIKPDLEIEKVITQYLDKDTADYTPNTIYLPGKELFDWSEDSTELTYYFKLTKDSDGNDVADTGYTKVTSEVGPKNAGTYLIKVEYVVQDSNPDDDVNDSHTITQEVTFTINKADVDMSKVSFTSIDDVIYDKGVHSLEINYSGDGDFPAGITGVTYYYNDEVFAGASEVKYENGTVVPYEIVAKFTYDTENYKEVEDKKAYLKINPKPLTDSDISMGFTTGENNTNEVFYYIDSDLKEDIEGTFYVKFGSNTLVKGTDYNITFTNTSTIGNYTEKVTGSGNYTGEKEITYSIAKSSLIIYLNEDSSIYNSDNHQYFFEYSGTAIDFTQYITKVENSKGTAVDATISYRYKVLGTANYISTEKLPTTVNVYWIEITASHADYNSAVKEIQVRIKPIDISKGTITLETNEVTYDGSEQKVVFTVTYNGEELKNGTDYTATYSNNLNAGTATVTIVGKGNYDKDTSLSKNFTILKATPTITKTPTLSKNILVEGENQNITLGNDGEATFNNVVIDGNFTSNISSLSFPDGEEALSATASLSVKFTFVPSDTQNFNNVNTTVENSITMYAVAKNSSNNTYYGTIEKALIAASSGNKVWVIPQIFDITGFYPTIRTTAANKTVTVKSGVTLVLSYAGLDETTSGYKIYAENADKEAYQGDSAKDLTTGKAAQAVVAEGIKLEVNGTLTIGAFVGDRAAVGKHAVLMNKGTIELQSGASTYAYGYIKGTGTLSANSGSEIHDLMRIYDFAGARYAGGMFFKKLYVGLNGVGSSTTYNNIMPFQSYSMHNISCETYIYNGSTYMVRSQLNISNEIYAKEITLFGTGGMFQLTTDNGYVKRTVENTTGTEDINGDRSWTTSNQLVTQKEIYDFHSNATDNSITVNLYIIAIDVKITTSKAVALPISMMDINIKSGYRMDITTNAFKFLPGSKVNVEEGATLYIDSGVNIIFYDQYYDDYACYNSSGNLISPSSTSSFSYYSKHKSLYNNDKTVKDEYQSKLIVDGTLECNGNVGGLIESSKGTGTVHLSSGLATLNRLSSIKYLDVGVSDILGALTGLDMGGSVYEDKQTPKMHLFNGTTINDFTNSVAKGTYYGKAVDVNGDNIYSAEDGDLFGWRAEKVEIIFDLNGGTGTTPVSSGDKDATDGYTIQSGDLPSFDTLPTRTGYTFANKWSLDPDGNEIVVAGETTLYASTTLYVVWIPDPYKISYENRYFDSADNTLGNSFTDNPNCDENKTYTTYTIEDVVVLKRPTITINGKDLAFGGWFTNELCTDEYRITTIDNTIGDMTLYAYWYPADSTTINITYNLTIDSNVGTITNDIKPANDIATIVNDSIKWTPFDIGKNINENTTIDGYFYGWVKNGSIGWYYDSACTIPYNADVDTINEYLVKIYEEDTTQTLVLYGKILKKHSVYREEVHHTNTNTVLKKQSFVGWYSPGQSYTLPVASDFTNRTTDDTPYYLMYIYVNGASNSSDSIEITGNTVVSARYLRIVTVTIEGPGKKAGFWNYDLPIIVCSGFHGESTTNLNYASENNTANYSATGNTDTTLYVVEGAIIEVNNDKLDIAWGKSVSISNCTNNGDGTYTVGISDVTVKAE